MGVESEWEPELGDEATRRRWKWGWNQATGEATVWEVAGPGDGFPSHETYLRTAWGRTPDTARGDCLGFAELDPPTLLVHGYYGAEVPGAVVAAFGALAPTAAIAVR